MANTRKANKASEADTQRAILDYLTLKGIWHERRNTGAMVGEYKGRKRFTRFGKPGVADIMCTPWQSYFYEGIEIARVPSPCWIECKSPTGKQGAAQKQFQSEVEAAGHIFILARSLDDVIAVIG